MPKKLFIRTFGCQMNEYDSDKMADVLNASEGVVKTDNPEDAAMIAECSFWPCDKHGNKVRWPTDAEGKML